MSVALEQEPEVDAAALLIEFDRAWWEFFDYVLETDLRTQSGVKWESIGQRDAYRNKRRGLFDTYLEAMRACVEADVDIHRDYRWNDRLDGWRRRPNPAPPPSEIWERTGPPVDRLP